MIHQSPWAAGLVAFALLGADASGAPVQQAYLKASNTGIEDAFGFSVAISGDTMVIGAHQEDSAATGPNGDGSDNSALNSGAAYVFVRNQGVWSQQAYLKPSNTGTRDVFGWSVAVSGDTIVIGALGEGSNATGVNGDSTNNRAFQAGAAYIFERTGTNWTQQAYLKASNSGSGDEFGSAVAISGNTVLVGARFESSIATGVDGDQADNSAVGAGAAYVFVREGTNWSQQAYLKASNTGGGDGFGWSVALSGDVAVVGAPNEDSNAAGVDGIGADNSAPQAGAAYVFSRTGTTWTPQAYLKASNPDPQDFFGSSVSVSGDTIVVGAYQESSIATGVNGNENDNTGTNAGAAYVYVRKEGRWTQQAYLKASNTGLAVPQPPPFPPANDAFGFSVAISGDLILVGAPAESSDASGVNGEQNNDNTPGAGAAYAFSRTGTNWSQIAYLKASNPGVGDIFGYYVGISGDSAVVSALSEASNATGVDGDQANNSAAYSGAAYAFSGLGLDPCQSSSPTLTIASDASSGYLIRGLGAPGCACRLQRAPQVNGDWETLATLTPGASGSLEFNDVAPPPGQAFYRTIQP